MNRRLLGMAATAFALWTAASCSDGPASEITGIPLNDSTGDAALIVSASVTLAQSSIEVGQTTQATALLLDRRNRPLLLRVDWTSSNSSVATVSATGLVTAVSPGVVDIIATRGTKSGSASLTVVAPIVTAVPVASITIELPVSSLGVGQTEQAKATLRDANDNVLTGRAVAWSSSTVSVATTSALGMLTAVAAGATQINASSEGKTGSAALSVTATPPAAVASVSVAPATSSLEVGATVQLLVTARDANDSVLTGRIVTSSSADTAIASVNTLGLVTAVSAGNTQITVTSEGKSAIATITVTAATPPPPPATVPGTVSDLGVSAIASTSLTLSFTQVNDGTGQPASYDVRYAVAPISWGSAVSTTSGTCTTPIAGTAIGARVTCTVLGLSPSTNYNFQLVSFRGTLNVNAVFGALSNIVSASTTAQAPPPPPVPVASVSVSPATASLEVGATVQLLVTARDANNNVLTGRVVTSSSADAGIASVNSLGLVTAVSPGNTQITVTSEGQSAVATITVTAIPPPPPPPPAPVASVTVSPATSSLIVGATVQLVVTAFDANNNVLTGRVVTSSSANAGIASVNSMGLVTAVSAGTTQITVTSEGKTASATITVSAPPPVPVASVTVSPSSSSILIGGTVQLAAVTRDASGNVLTGRAISWSSANAGVATVSSTGRVTAMAAGTATITATSGSASGTASITASVPPPPPPPPPVGSAPEPGSGDTMLWQDSFDGTNPLGSYAKRGVTQMISNGHSGSAVRFPYTSTSNDNLIEKTFSTSTDVYFRYWYRTSPGMDPTCGDRGGSGMKWFMAWRESGVRYTQGVGNLSNGPTGRNNLGDEFSSHDNGSSGMPNPFLSNVNSNIRLSTTNDGQWHKYTLHIVTSSGDGTGYEQIWIDGTLVLDNSANRYDHNAAGIMMVNFPGVVVNWYSGCDFTIDVDDLAIWRK